MATANLSTISAILVLLLPVCYGVDIKDGVNFFNNSGKVFLFLKGMKFDGTELISNDSSWDPKGSCGKDKLSSICLQRKKPAGNVTFFSLLIEMITDEDEWHCKQLSVKVSLNNKAKIDLNYPCDSNSSSQVGSTLENTISAPLNMSYSCGSMTFRQGNNDSRYELSFSGMQLQPNIQNNKFDNAYSCVGFFTLEILTGIFVSIIIALGLLVGISMMMAIQTQDRFDDPKGQTISVPTQE